jgi:uncharacterized protein (DUF2267 family)
MARLRFFRGRAISSLVVVLALSSSARITTRLLGEEPTSTQTQAAPLPFTILRETSFVTEPVRKNGTIDYAAAENAIFSKGVTPGTNATVKIIQAFGPKRLDIKARQRYFQLLGIEPLPERGDYFIEIQDFLRRDFESKKITDANRSGQALNDVFEHQDAALRRAWTKQEFPELANWLSANEKPLALVVAASKCPSLYEPTIPINNQWFCCSVSQVQQLFRSAAYALGTRATLRAGEGRLAEAWDDLLAIHRLARLEAEGPDVAHVLVGDVVEGIAFKAEQVLFQSARLSAADALKMRADLEKLLPLADLSRAINFDERFMFLDFVAIIVLDRAPKKPNDPSDPLAQDLDGLAKFAHETNIDWNLVLRTGNEEFNRIVEAHGKRDRKERHDALAEIRRQMRAAAATPNELRKLLSATPGSQTREIVSKRFASSLVNQFSFETAITDKLQDRNRLWCELSKLAFSLEAYRAERGEYPPRLGDLAPKYAAEIPQDIFSGSDLHYRREGSGYLLYSVGMNGRDDGSRSRDDPKNLDSDDIVVRVADTSHNKP